MGFRIAVGLAPLCGVLFSACAFLSWPGSLPPRACPRTVVKVVYIDASGTIPDPFAERYTITPDEIRFERTGDVDGPVNRGVWVIEASPEPVRELFDELGTVNCRQIRPIFPAGWPDMAPIGGGSRSYIIEGEDGTVFELRFAEGVTYRNAQAITDPIREFLAAFELPPEARGPYLDP